MLEFKMMKNTIPPTLIVEIKEVLTTSKVSILNALAKRETPNTPKAADSVGVAIPKIIRPITIKTTKAIGMMLVSTIMMLCFQVKVGVS